MNEELDDEGFLNNFENLFIEKIKEEIDDTRRKLKASRNEVMEAEKLISKVERVLELLKAEEEAERKRTFVRRMKMF